MYVCIYIRNVPKVPLEDVGGLRPHIIASPMDVSGSATEWLVHGDTQPHHHTRKGS